MKFISFPKKKKKKKKFKNIQTRLTYLLKDLLIFNIMRTEVHIDFIETIEKHFPKIPVKICQYALQIVEEKKLGILNDNVFK